MPSSELLRRAIAGVMRGGQEGRLPLFAWTLGLPQDELLRMLAHCFAELPPLEPMGTLQYAAVQESTLTHFHDLVGLLLAHSTHKVVEPRVRWLAHALAAACFGGQHLWEELELDSRASVSLLLQTYFAPLHQANTAQLRWKRFLFEQLAQAVGTDALRPPKCHQCDDFALCYPAATNAKAP